MREEKNLFLISPLNQKSIPVWFNGAWCDFYLISSHHVPCNHLTGVHLLEFLPSRFLFFEDKTVTECFQLVIIIYVLAGEPSVEKVGKLNCQSFSGFILNPAGTRLKRTTNQRIVEFQSFKWMGRDGKSCKKEEEKFNAKQRERGKSSRSSISSA